MRSIYLSSVLILTTLLVGFSSCKKEATPVTLTVDELLASPDQYVGDTIVVQGTCTHVCKHAGCKLFLQGSDEEKSLRVEAGEVVGSFPQDCATKVLKVTGVLEEDRIDEAYLQEWEAEVAKQLEAQQAEDKDDVKEACGADQKANAEKIAKSVAERIANFRTRIAERTEKEGKPYVSLYHVVAVSYEVVPEVKPD